MSYQDIQRELEKSISEIRNEAGRYENEYGYPEGLQDAINYLDNLVLMVAEYAQNERHKEISERTIEVSPKQKNLL